MNPSEHPRKPDGQHNTARLNRRAVLKAGAAAGLISTVPWNVQRVQATLPPEQVKLEDPKSNMTPFVNPLPNPLAEAFRMKPGPSGNTYDVSLVNTTHVFHENDGDPWETVETDVFAYRDNNDDSAFGSGTFPGKTFVVESGKSSRVKYTNELFDGQFLPIDTTVHGASGEDKSNPRTVTHQHGGKTQPPSDGNPEDTRTPGKPQVMQYSDINPASTLWYHDHALGITRLNVYAGLAGFYIVRDEDEADLNLPSGDYEIPIVLQDRCFDTEGNLFYPYEGEDVDGNPIGTPENPRVPLEFFGNVSVVNGKVWPRLEVEPRKYRLRFLNGSNSRFYNLEIQHYNGGSGNSPTVHQIGTDGGFLFDGPETLTDRLLLAPGERADVVVDFSGINTGTEFLLHNNAGSPFKGGNFGGDDALPDIMLFEVVDSSGPDNSEVPSTLPASFPGLEELSEEDAVNVRRLTLLEGVETIPTTDGAGTVDRLQPRLGVLPNLEGQDTLDVAELEGDLWDDPVTEDPKVNQAEVWELYNFTEDTHPIHLHIVQFKILGKYELVENGGEFALDEFGVPEREETNLMDTNERGPKDTVRANPGEVTRILVPFDTFPGETVWHCHILEHEDNEMMRPMKVGGKPNKNK